MSRRIVVELTKPQIDAIIAALAYCLAGAPDDIGRECDRAGWALMANMLRAQTVMFEAAP